MIVGRFRVTRPDPWTPIFNAMVDELAARELQEYRTRYVLGVDATAMQDGINKAIERMRTVQYVTPTTYIPMRGTA